MPRILLSLALIAVTAGALIGGTGAFFGDTETSTANVFAAGAIDLKVDNESYYNLNKCTEITPGVWQWQGTASYPVVGTPCTTSWTLDDLDNGHLFFDFTDVKPDDEGEDTISLHVQNDAWACMNLSLTANDDNSSNEPELGAGDILEDEANIWDGELAQAIQMFWWADDGDNVYEEGELSISGGVKTLLDLGYTNGALKVAIADAAHNAWGTPGPLPANDTVYLAKAWCFGTLAPTPLANDASTGPQVRGTGFTCNGTELGNLTQTDTATLDIQFSAVQARHNPDFLCTPREEPTTGELIVTKVIVGDAAADDFNFTVNGGSPTAFEVDGTNVIVLPAGGEYDVLEEVAPNWITTYTNSQNAEANCDNLVVPAGDNVTCTVTNTFDEPELLFTTITIEKSVVGGTATAGDFSFTIDDVAAVLGSNITTAGAHTVSEVAVPNYTPTYSGACDEEGNITAIQDSNVTCTITNTFVPPPLISEDFGTGDCLQDIPGWDEDPGDTCVNGTVAAAIGTGDNTASPDGGRFALIGNNGYICRAVNATGLQNLQLKYYWRGDTDAEVSDNGVVQYYTSGTCAVPVGVVTVATHDLDNPDNDLSEPWSALQTINLPGALNNTTFFIRIAANTNGGNESMRFDGVTLTGTAI